MGTSDSSRLHDEQGMRLVGLAEQALRYAVHTGDRLPLGGREFEALPSDPRATFVTLRCEDELAGCIGTVEPKRGLPEDVVHNAHGAALRDPRVPALEPEHLPKTDAEVSVLTPLEPLEVGSTTELVEALEPGDSGLVLATDEARGAMLPSVWEKCDGPEAFVAATKRKAGLVPRDWPDSLRAFEFHAQSFERRD